MQNLGVIIFFILFGFLITYSVDNKSKQYKFIDFFIDRFSRIYIAFVPALLFILMCDLVIKAFGGEYIYSYALTGKSFIQNLLMLQDHPLLVYGFSKIYAESSVTSFGSGRPLWSVAVEWWIYMFYGFIIYKKVSFKNAIIFIFLFLVPLYNMSGEGNGLSIVCFLGMLAYYLLKTGILRLNYPYLVIFILLAASVYRLRMNDYMVYDLTFSVPLTFAFIFLIEQLQHAQNENVVLKKIASFSKFISSYSFSLYLVHYSVIMLVMSFNILMNKCWQILLLFCLCNIIAWSFAYFTEFRYHTFRNFIKKRNHSYVG